MINEFEEGTAKMFDRTIVLPLLWDIHNFDRHIIDSHPTHLHQFNRHISSIREYLPQLTIGLENETEKSKFTKDRHGRPIIVELGGQKYEIKYKEPPSGGSIVDHIVRSDPRNPRSNAIRMDNKNGSISISDNGDALTFEKGHIRLTLYESGDTIAETVNGRIHRLVSGSKMYWNNANPPRIVGVSDGKGNFCSVQWDKSGTTLQKVQDKNGTIVLDGARGLIAITHDGKFEQNNIKYDLSALSLGTLKLEMPKLVEAPAIPNAGCTEIRAGTVIEQLDGSKVTYDLAADGNVRPTKIAYSNGDTSDYTYDKKGRLSHVISKDKEGNEISAVTSAPQKDHLTYTLTYLARVKDANGTWKSEKRTAFANRKGSLCARTDGTWKVQITGENPQIWQSCSDGSRVTDYKPGTVSFRTISLPDDSMIRLRKSDSGEFRPSLAIYQDGTEITYRSGDNARITVTKPFASPVVYEKTSAGNLWTRTIKHTNDANHLSQTGTLTLDNNFRPVFRDNGEKPLEVTDNYEKADKARARVFKLQKTLELSLDQVYDGRMRKKLQDVRDQWIQELKKRVKWDTLPAADKAEGVFNKLSVKDREEALKDLIKRNTHAIGQLNKEKQKDLLALRAEQEQLRNLVKVELKKPENERKKLDELWKELPHTKKLYKSAIEWLEKSSVPAALSALCGSNGSEIPPNNPHAIPKWEGTRFFLDPSYYRSLVAGGKFLDEIKLGIDTEKPPTEQSLEKLGRAMEWLVEVQQRTHKARLDYEVNVLLPSIIKDNNLPERWLKDFGENPEGKRAAMKEMVDVAFKLRNYMTAMTTLKLDQAGDRPAWYWRSGASRDKIPPPPFSQKTQKDGKTIYRFDWPESLNLEDPKNLEKLEAFKKWLDQYGEKIDKVLEAWAAFGQDPRRRLFYGEIEGDVYVKFDKDGKLSKVIEPIQPGDSPEAKKQKEQEIKDATKCNLLSSNFEIQERNGRIFVKATLQAKNARLRNYLNIGAQAVGRSSEEYLGDKDSNGQPLGFAPDDPVAIRDASGQMHMVEAGKLQAWKSHQKFLYWGHKVTTAVMDFGITAAGFASAGSAFAAGASLRALSGVARVALGGSGFLLNNAKAHADPTWHKVNEVRGALMVIDVAQGTLRGIGGWAGFGKSPEAVAAAQKYALAVEEGFKQSKSWIMRGMVKPLHLVTEADGWSKPYHWLMGGSNLFFGPTIAQDIIDHRFAIKNAGKRDPFEAAKYFTQEGRAIEGSPRTPEKNLAEQRKRENVKLFDSYITLILQRKDSDATTKAKVLEIANKTRQLLNPKLPDQLAKADVPESKRQAWHEQQKTELDKYKAELLEHFYGPADQLSKQIADHNKGKDISTASGDYARNRTTGGFVRNRDLELAAGAAILALSTGEDGALPKDGILGKRTLQLPDHKMTKQEKYTHETAKGPVIRTRTVDVDGPKTASQDIRIADLTPLLKENVKDGNPAAKMVSADLLVKLGERNQLSYAAVLRDTLYDSAATNNEKACAIAQLGQMINGLRLIEAKIGDMSPEEQESFRAHSYGLTSRDLHNHLKLLAGNKAADKNLRGLAAGLIADLGTGLRPEEIDLTKFRECVEKRVKEFAEYDSPESKKRGSYSDAVIVQLEQDLKSGDPAIRLRAILALRDIGDLGPFNDNNGKIKFNAELVKVAEVAAGNGRYQEAGVRAIAELDLSKNDMLSLSDRQSLRKILEKPTDHNTAVLKSAIARRAHEIAQTHDEKTSFAKTLAEHISHDKPTYAERFSGLREAAIHALSNLGITSHSDSLIKCLRPPEEGKYPYRDYEPDARIRLAALNALVRYGAAGLDRVITDAFEKETDAAVRARLLELKIQTHRPVPDWTWFHERDRLAAQAIDGSRYSINDAPDWLCKLKPPLSYQNDTQGIVVPEPTCEKTEDVYEMRWKCERDGLGGKIWIEEMQKVGTRQVTVANPDYATFWKAWDEQVRDRARKDSAEGLAARMALIQLVLKNGDPIGGTDKNANRRKAADNATDRIIELIHPGSGFKGEMLPGVRDILADPMVNPAIRKRLLEALQKYLKGSPMIEANLKERGIIDKNANLSAEYRVTVGQYVAEALSRDLTHVNQVKPEKEEEYKARLDLRLKMLDVLRELKPYQALKTLEAVSIISDQPWLARNKVFHERARDVLADIRDSVKVMWDSTPKSNGSAAQRTELLRKALSVPPANARNKDHNSGAIAEAVFRASKGLPIKDASDTRIPFIRLALNNESSNRKGDVPSDTASLAAKIVDPSRESNASTADQSWEQNGSQQVRLAAALVVLESENIGFSQADRRKALSIVADLAFNGQEYGYRRDAMQLLKAAIAKPDNKLALYGLRDLALNKRGKWKEAQKLLQESFKGSKEVERLPDGRVIQMRKVGDGVAVEEFKGDKLLRATPPLGLTYAEALVKIASDKAHSLQERFTAVKRLLSDEPIGAPAPSDKQRQAVLDEIQEIIEDNSKSVEDRYAVAEYLVKTDRLHSSEAKYCDVAINYLARIAIKGDAKALSLLRTLSPQKKEKALNDMVSQYADYNADCRRKNKANADQRKALKDLADREEKRGVRRLITDGDLLKRFPYVEPDKGILAVMIKQFCSLEASISPSRKSDASVFNLYSRVCSDLGKDHLGTKILQRHVNAAAERLRKDPATDAHDPRWAFVPSFLANASDKQRLDNLCNELRTATGDVTRLTLYHDVGKLIKSQDDTVGEAAAKVLENATAKDKILFAVMVNNLISDTKRSPQNLTEKQKTRIERLARSFGEQGQLDTLCNQLEKATSRERFTLYFRISKLVKSKDDNVSEAATKIFETVPEKDRVLCRLIVNKLKVELDKTASNYTDQQKKRIERLVKAFNNVKVARP